MDQDALIDRFRENVTRLNPQLKQWRRHLHANPELSFSEHETQAYVRRELEGRGLAAEPLAGTGLALVIGPDRATCIGLRADLDALPIQEVEGRDYGSRVDGVMHACGHDVHTTCAMGASLLLAEAADHLPMPVKVLFQPGEEVLPGGATHMIRDGALQTPEVVAIAALHVAPDLAVGTFGTRPGAYMASSDEIRFTFHGPGGHGALPHQTVDLVAVAAQTIVALQQVVSRKAPAAVPSVLSFGHVASGGGATNVLPVRVALAGTFRTYDAAWRERAVEWIEAIVKGTAEMYGAEVTVDIGRGYPALVNDASCTTAVESGLRTAFGTEAVVALGLRPTAEDFAWYLQHVPGAFFRLGVGNAARGISAGVHTPEFDVDEDCLGLGAVAMASAAVALGARFG